MNLNFSIPNVQSLQNMHYLVLYPYFIQQIGPLIHFSCMQFESKLVAMKAIVSAGYNCNNVPHLVAMQCQFELATKLADGNVFSND